MNRCGIHNSNWKGGTMDAGEKGKYRATYSPDHPRATDNHVLAHILVAESAHGKFLPAGAVVHHSDGNERNNEKSNLVICQDQAYHKIIHARMKALRICGHATWRKCHICHQYDDPDNLFICATNKSAVHRRCQNKYAVERRKLRNLNRAA